MQILNREISDQGRVRFDDVSFAYPAQRDTNPKFVFTHFNLDIPAGSCVLFCGPSGSGKSTALKMFNGLIPQLQPGHIAGKIMVSGVNLNTVKLVDMGRLSATVFQNPRTQFFTGNVLAELAYAGENYQVPVSELKQRCMKAAKDIGIAHLLERNLCTLSGGQLQAVAQASALAAHVPVLLFDEPTSNLSPSAIVNFTRHLQEQKERGKTIVIAEHRLYFLRNLVDQVVYFHSGETPEIIDGKKFFQLDDSARRNIGIRTLHEPECSEVPVMTINQDPRRSGTSAASRK
ncbi:ABC transporter ATP-binding protein [Arcanobacterium hippocoleae]